MKAPGGVCWRHPQYMHLLASSDGRVYSESAGRNIGSLHNGRVKITVQEEGKPHQCARARLVWEAVHGCLLVRSQDIEIDHINSEPSDDAPANLQALTKIIHALKTRKATRESGKGKPRTGSVAIKGTHSSGTTGRWTSYLSAASSLGVPMGTLRKIVSRSAGLEITSGKLAGWTLLIDSSQCEPQYSLPGETWKRGTVRAIRATGTNIAVITEASSLGRVKATRGRGPATHITRGTLGADGYRRVAFIASDGKYYAAPVHRVVATLFVSEPPSTSHVVDHIDANKENNSSSNLRWATPSQNISYALAVAVECIDATTGAVVARYASVSKAAKTVHVGVQNICAALYGRSHTSGGFKWRVARST